MPWFVSVLSKISMDILESTDTNHGIPSAKCWQGVGCISPEREEAARPPLYAQM